MIKSSTLINFQSHVKSVLEFHPNVNVIFGLSDSGKSSWIRAFDSLFKRNSFYLRKKQDIGSVEFELDDCKIKRAYSVSKLKKCPGCKEKLIEDIAICKCGEILDPNVKEDAYTFDGTEYKSFGTKLPDFILKKTKIFPIDFVDFQEFLQLSSQHGEMFFIADGYSGNKRNKIISSLIPDSGKVDFVVKQLNSEIPKENTELEFHIEKKNLIEEKLEKIKEDLELADKLNTEFDQIQKDIEKNKHSLLILNDINGKLVDLNKVLKIKDSVKKTESHFKAISNLLESNIKYKKEQEQLSFLNKIKVEINKILSIQDKFEKQTELLAEIIYITTNYTNDVTYISKIKDINLELNKIKRFNSVKLQSFDISVVNNLITKHNKIKDETIRLSGNNFYFTSSKVEMISLQEQVKKITMEISVYLKDNPLCPITNKEYCLDCKKSLGC